MTCYTMSRYFAYAFRFAARTLRAYDGFHDGLIYIFTKFRHIELDFANGAGCAR